MQMFQYEQQALWTFLISHEMKEVLHHIQLDVTYSDIDRNKDTYDLWALLKCSTQRVLIIYKIFEMNGQISGIFGFSN